jgi:CHAT domain-containing protein/tetratricopeptide (TPR) repeat protein
MRSKEKTDKYERGLPRGWSPTSARLVWVRCKCCCAIALLMVLLPLRIPHAYAETAQKGEVRQLIQRAFDAFARKDLDDFMVLWSIRSPDYEIVRVALVKMFAGLGTMRLERVEIKSLSIEEDEAEASAEAILELADDHDPRTASHTEAVIREFIFHNERGRWKLFRFSQPNEVIEVGLLRSAPAERPGLIKGIYDWQESGVRDLLTGQAKREVDRDDYREAHRVADIICEIGRIRRVPEAVAACEFTHGNIYTNQNEPLAAAESFARAQVAFHQLGDAASELRSVIDHTKAEYRVDRYQDLLPDLAYAKELERKVDDPFSRAEILFAYAGAYQNTGNMAAAIGSLQQGVQAATRDGTSKGKSLAAEMSLLAGNLVLFGGDRNGISAIQEVARHYSEASRFAQQAGNKQLIAKTIAGTAQMLHWFCISSQEMWRVNHTQDFAGPCHQAEEALVLSTRAADIFGAPQDRLEPLIELGMLYARLGRTQEALETYKEVLAAADPDTQARFVVNANDGLGELFASQNKPDWEQAIPYFEAGVNSLEKSQAGKVGESAESRLLGVRNANYDVYSNLANATLMLHKSADAEAQAFKLAEQSRSRLLVDLLASEKVDVSIFMTDDEKRQEKRINDQLVAARLEWERARSQPGEDFGEATRKLNEARSEQETFRRRLFAAHSELRSQRREPVSLTDVNKLLHDAGPGTAMLSYLIIGKHAGLLFVLRRAERLDAPARVDVVPLQIQISTERLAENFREACASGKDYEGPAKELYRNLLEPAEGKLTGISHLIIIPDKFLQIVPFQALIDGDGRFLVETYAISYAPSATALVEMHELAKRRIEETAHAGHSTFQHTMVAVGNPNVPPGYDPLVFSEAEAREVGKIFAGDSLVLLDKCAVPSRVKQEMASARFVHLATHGVVRPESPMSSAVVLSTEGGQSELEAREIAQMSLKAEMVVLSACDTAVGQQVAGEGIIGLTWALFAARTPTTVVTLWQIGDESTKDLIVQFYKRLTGADRRPAVSKAAALQDAQQMFIHDCVHKNPKYWAAFVLIGDWGSNLSRPRPRVSVDGEFHPCSPGAVVLEPQH